MTTIQKLPYVEPDKPVTAKHRANNLKEHLEAFLSINCLDSDLDAEFEDECEVGAIVNIISRATHITRDQFGSYLQQFTVLLPELNREQIGRLIARSLGYRTEERMWLAGIKENIPTARVRLQLVRAKSIERAQTGKGTVIKFRAAVLTNRRVTPAEIQILNPVYRDFFVRNITKQYLNWDEVKKELNGIRYDEPGKKRPGTAVDSHGMTLDSLILCLGYVTMFAALTAYRQRGHIENLRYLEHTKIFGTK